MKSCIAFMDDKTQHCEGAYSSYSLFIDPMQFQDTKKKKRIWTDISPSVK